MRNADLGTEAFTFAVAKVAYELAQFARDVSAGELPAVSPLASVLLLTVSSELQQMHYPVPVTVVKHLLATLDVPTQPEAS